MNFLFDHAAQIGCTDVQELSGLHRAGCQDQHVEPRDLTQGGIEKCIDGVGVGALRRYGADAVHRGAVGGDIGAGLRHAGAGNSAACVLAAAVASNTLAMAIIRI